MTSSDRPISYQPTDGLTYDPEDAAYWQPALLDKEITRVFEVCHGCRMCFKYCDSFPTLFGLLDDDAHGGDVRALRRDEIASVMGQCFQCKLCEVQCPYTPRDGHEYRLDFPKLVHRYQAVQARAHGVRWRDRVLADPDRAGTAARASLGMANAMNRVPAHRWLMEKALGIHRDKLLPPFAPSTFERWAERTGRLRAAPAEGAPQSRSPEGAPQSGRPEGAPQSGRPEGAPQSGRPEGAPQSGRPEGAPQSGRPEGAPQSGRPEGAPQSGRPEGAPQSGRPEGAAQSRSPEVVLFQTCYVQNNEPQIGRDTVDVLERNQVSVACVRGLRCCGMPAWEHGDLDTLRGNARANLDILAPHVQAGARVLAINPTCAMMMRREYPELVAGPDRERARALAAAVQDPGEFLWSIRREPRFSRDFKTTPARIAYHAPCHLRAQAVGFKGRDLLRQIPGVSVQSVLECCGHDGTYAMKVESFEASRRIGQKAFTGMGEAGGEVWVTECPLAAVQFEQHAGVKALHPMTVLARAYRADGFPAAAPPPDASRTPSPGDEAAPPDGGEAR